MTIITECLSDPELNSYELRVRLRVRECVRACVCTYLDLLLRHATWRLLGFSVNRAYVVRTLTRVCVYTYVLLWGSVDETILTVFKLCTAVLHLSVSDIRRKNLRYPNRQLCGLIPWFRVPRICGRDITLADLQNMLRLLALHAFPDPDGCR